MFFPSGAIQIFVVIDHPPVIPQVVLKSSDCRKIFVLAHSHRKPLSVFSGIAIPFMSVSKYFTPSTFAPWNGATVSTPVETYSEGVWIDCPVTSSSCILQIDIPDTPSHRLANKRASLIDEIITIPCPAFVPNVDTNLTVHLYQPFHSSTTEPAPAVPAIDQFVRSKF